MEGAGEAKPKIKAGDIHKAKLGSSSVDLDTCSETVSTTRVMLGITIEMIGVHKCLKKEEDNEKAKKKSTKHVTFMCLDKDHEIKASYEAKHNMIKQANAESEAIAERCHVTKGADGKLTKLTEPVTFVDLEKGPEIEGDKTDSHQDTVKCCLVSPSCPI